MYNDEIDFAQAAEAHNWRESRFALSTDFKLFSFLGMKARFVLSRGLSIDASFWKGNAV